MPGRDKPTQAQPPRKPQLEPFAPPDHPDVNVPEQQFEGDSKGRRGAERERPEQGRRKQ